jgi:hypothetical protein
MRFARECDVTRPLRRSHTGWRSSINFSRSDLNNRMDKLEATLSDLGSRVDDEYEAQCIYDHIKTNIAPNVSKDECPPVSVLCYTARRYISPTLEYDDIPRLLYILVNVEEARKKVVQLATEALDGTGMPLLTQVSKARAGKKLKKVANAEKAADVRLVFVSAIILPLCKLVSNIRLPIQRTYTNAM